MIFVNKEVEPKVENTIRNKCRQNPYREYNGITLEELRPGYCRMSMEIKPYHLNSFGTIHGGVFCVLADNTTGDALHTDGRVHVTKNANLNYIRNQDHGPIICEAQVTHYGKTISLVDFTITNAEGKTLISGTYNYFCVAQHQ